MLGLGGSSAAMGVTGDPASGTDNPVMQMMMAQQMQFQQDLMNQDVERQEKERETQLQREGRSGKTGKQKGHGKFGTGPKKELEVPLSLQAHPDLLRQLMEFLDKYPFEDHHKQRTMNAMGPRIDTFQEDIETLHMIMGAANNPCAFLVSSVKRMEDGVFQPREAGIRSQWRRSEEIKQEAANNNKLVKKAGSVRQAFQEQQKLHTAEMARNREDELASKGQGKGSRRRSSSRSRKGSRRKSRSRSRSRSSRSRSGGRSRRR